MTNKIEGLQGLAKFFAGKAIERIGPRRWTWSSAKEA
jgi:hypothetical protein